MLSLNVQRVHNDVLSCVMNETSARLVSVNLSPVKMVHGYSDLRLVTRHIEAN